MSVLALALLTGLAAAGATFVIRAVVDEFRKEWLLEKPLACDLCMSWWSSLALALPQWPEVGGAKLVSVVLASVAVSVAALKVVNRLAA